MFFAISYFNTFISHLTNKDTYQVLISICKKTSPFFPVLHSTSRTSTYLLDLLVKALFKSQAISPAFLAHKTHVCQLSQGCFNANCHIPPMGWPFIFFLQHSFEGRTIRESLGCLRYRPLIRKFCTMGWRRNTVIRIYHTVL